MKKFFLVSLVIALCVLGYYFLNPESQSPQHKRPSNIITPVVVTKVETKKLTDELEALGNIKANESIDLTSKVSELVTHLYFDDGAMVRKGQLLVQLRDASQQAALRQAKVALANDERDLRRIVQLVKDKSIAETEKDQAQTQIDTAKAQVKSAIADVRDRKIVAPFSGRLGLRQVSVGALVTPSTVITTLDDLSTVKLDFSVPERYLQTLQVGKEVEAKAIAYPDETFKGKVKSIDSRIDPETRAVVIRAVLKNPQMKLLPGMLMTVNLIKDHKTSLVLPEDAIIPRQNRQYVYVVDDKNKVVQKQVTVGIRKFGIVEITSGLKEGESVITRGQLKVRPGSTVQPHTQENFTFKKNAQGEDA
ncbi:efflux RND transporter periplasmic adaptor subunit [Parashewanella curva]|uniref:Efflux RND transporter periplasmic adaptor subunit n=1 Tax=Parashewanella curva TaxID=2338552 RepID=A0A3L8Q3D9_9GAMM|nr:efflux RND transporter periplasmic adaptor subunit [Parashewanella curva]RLV61729.1 efflux RND transporter periplasmic adaptor subunit [Parashewanella curva]